MSEQINLLFILTDDQGYWAMGCAGNSGNSHAQSGSIGRNGIAL